MARWILAWLAVVSFGCGGSTSTADTWTIDDIDGDDDDTEVGPGSVRADRVALTTEVDPITFGPAAPAAKTFPASTQRLFLSFRLRGVRPGSTLTVRWLRQGEDEPLSETSQVLDGDQRLAAEHVADQPFAPGPHLVRVEIDGERLIDVPFRIEGQEPEAALTTTAESDNPAEVSRLGLYLALDRRGRPRGQPLTRFRHGITTINAAFLVTGAPRGTQVSVRWLLGRTVVATTEVGEVSGRRILAATLNSPEPLEPGQYQVEVLIDGARRAGTEFTVQGGQGGRAQVRDLSLTATIDRRTHRPLGSPQTSFSGNEEAIYLCLSYRGMTRGEPVEVRWFQDDQPDEPLAVSTVRVNHTEGNLAASLLPEGPLPPGGYHAEVYLRGQEVESISFTVSP